MAEVEQGIQPIQCSTLDTPLDGVGLPAKQHRMPNITPIDLLSTTPRGDFFPAPQPTPPRTYSFQESTFGRRIFRAATEAAYRLLLDPERKPADYERIFRLSLMGCDRAEMIASVKSVLDKGPHEELDSWTAPLIHVGGAGTHYARRDPFGNLQPRKASHNLGLIGPQALALLENAARDNISTVMTVEVVGFEGEWFDPFDVQGYLEEEGIFIDPSASFAEAEILEWPPTPSSPSAESSTQHLWTPSTDGFIRWRRSTNLSADQLAHLSYVDADLTQWNDFIDMDPGEIGHSDTTGSWMNCLQSFDTTMQHYQGDRLRFPAPRMGVAESTLQSCDVFRSITTSHPPQMEPRRKTVIIDVAKFIECNVQEQL